MQGFAPAAVAAIMLARSMHDCMESVISPGAYTGITRTGRDDHQAVRGGEALNLQIGPSNTGVCFVRGFNRKRTRKTRHTYSSQESLTTP